MLFFTTSETIDGDWVQPDLIPSTDREKRPPHIHRNKSTTFSSIDMILFTVVQKDVLKKFKNRE